MTGCPDCEAEHPEGSNKQTYADLHRALHGLWANVVLAVPLWRRYADVPYYERIVEVSRERR